MKTILIACCLLFALKLPAQKTIISDPNAEARSASGFTSISVSGGIDLYLSQGDEDGVAVSAADRGSVEHIQTKVVNNELKIYFDAKGFRYKRGGKHMIAYVSFRQLQKLSASGSCDVYVNGVINAEELDIRLSGASDFKGKVDVGRLVIDQSGACDVNISGNAGTLKVEASGASDLKGYDLVAGTCSAEASGASDIQVSVSKELSASASGASSIHYKGSGTLKSSRASGASNVSKKG